MKFQFSFFLVTQLQLQNFQNYLVLQLQFLFSGINSASVFCGRVMLLDGTMAVLSLGKLCEDHGFYYHWTICQKPHLINNGRKMECTHGELRTIRCRWSTDKFFKLIFTHISYIFIAGSRNSNVACRINKK